MAAPRFLARIAGRIRMVVTIATSAGVADAEKVPSTNASGFLDPSIINATATSAGAGDAGKVGQLDGTGRFSTTMMPVGVAADTSSIVTSEALTAGNLVNVWNDGGTPKVRKADATAEGKEVNGFVLSGFGSAATALVYHEGRITGLSGLTPGARYFLSAASPGGVVLAASIPSASGNVQQFVGVALSATELSFEPDEPTTVA